jgi:glucose/arabinose dehydrogenase
MRDVRTGPDGTLYLLTDEPDGRVLRVSPSGAALAGAIADTAVLD